jgi:demethylmenaquinone methyltransferase/2-methoxy-6-polyprenyl-1,4-benzoquinol methylase
MQQDKRQTTHFGYREVPVQEKARLVHDVFESVAGRYDLMNDLMSLGIHRAWKRDFAGNSGVRLGDRVLDLAGGTGDIAALLSRMGGIVRNVRYALVNAETLPFADGRFDAVTMAFGLRNVTDKDQALSEMLRVLKPGGRALILEFSEVQREPLKLVYDAWSFGVLPLLGKLVADDEDSYRYLAESIRKHPAQEELAEMMRLAGFSDVRYRNLSGGIVAIHSGVRA